MTLKAIESGLKKNARVVRVMPNTPCLVREGASAVAAGSQATENDLKGVVSMMSAVGTCVEVPVSAVAFGLLLLFPPLFVLPLSSSLSPPPSMTDVLPGRRAS
jgi:hypothetical protein